MYFTELMMVFTSRKQRRKFSKHVVYEILHDVYEILHVVYDLLD